MVISVRIGRRAVTIFSKFFEIKGNRFFRITLFYSGSLNEGVSENNSFRMPYEIVLDKKYKEHPLF